MVTLSSSSDPRTSTCGAVVDGLHANWKASPGHTSTPRRCLLCPPAVQNTATHHAAAGDRAPRVAARLRRVLGLQVLHDERLLVGAGLRMRSEEGVSRRGALTSACNHTLKLRRRSPPLALNSQRSSGCSPGGKGTTSISLSSCNGAQQRGHRLIETPQEQPQRNETSAVGACLATTTLPPSVARRLPGSVSCLRPCAPARRLSPGQQWEQGVEAAAGAE